MDDAGSRHRMMPRPTGRLVRWLTVLAVATVAIGLWPGVSQAAPGRPRPKHPAARTAHSPTPPLPRTSKEALAQLRAYNDEFEKVTERYNDAGVLLQKRQAEARVAGERMLSAQAEYASLDGELKHIVRASYMGLPFGRTSTLLTGQSPQDYVEKMAALDAVTSRRAHLLATAEHIRTEAIRMRAAAQTAAASAAKLTADLSVQRADLARRASESRAMFERLSARERAAFLARQAALAAERASRAIPRYGSVPNVTILASGRAATAVAWAMRELGKPYIWAAEGPDSFDCSGLTRFVWGKAGVDLPHSAQIQSTMGVPVSNGQLQPGDLVFFGFPVHHVGIYVGSGMMINAPQSNDVVRYAGIGWPDYAGARRIG